MTSEEKGTLLRVLLGASIIGGLTAAVCFGPFYVAMAIMLLLCLVLSLAFVVCLFFLFFATGCIAVEAYEDISRIVRNWRGGV